MPLLVKQYQIMDYMKKHIFLTTKISDKLFSK